jgi:hypothetical protein
VKTIVRGLAAGTVLAGATVGLAAPASAGPLDGAYTATITQATPAGQGADPGKTMSVILSDCGPDCTKFLSSANAFVGDLRLQGNIFAGSVTSGKSGMVCNATLDNGSLYLVIDCPSMPANVQYQLARKP